MTAPRPTLPATFWAAIILHAVFALVGWFVPPSMNSDSATGFYVWDSWRAGAPWNHMIVPDSADLARDASFFQSWWSPGQYLVVAPWQLLGLSLGHAIVIGGFVATLAALLGFWRLYRTYGFGEAPAGWAVLAVACNWTLARTYGDFMGGETALLAVLPWVILAMRRAVEAGTLSWLAIPALYWLGAMAKNSYIPIGAGLIAGLRGLRLWGRPWLSAPKFTELARWAGWFALGHFLFWFTYLRLGTAPGADFGGRIHPDWWISAFRVLGFPISAIYSLGNILGRIFLHPSHPLVSDMAALWPLHALVAAAAVGISVWLLRREFSLRPAWARLVLGVTLANLAFFGLVLLWRDPAGLEERFFKPVAFLFLPALVAVAGGGRPRWLGSLLCAALVVSSLYGVASYANRAHYLAGLANPGFRGTTQNVLSADGLRVLHALDAALPPRSLVVVPSPEMALEVRRVRVLPTHAVMMETAQLSALRYHGRTGNLVVLVDDRMITSGKAGDLLSSFSDYPSDSWTVHRYGEWSFYHQGPFDRWPTPPSAP